MNIKPLPVNSKFHDNFDKFERVLNSAIRNYDKAKGLIGIGGRKGRYDDYNFEFVGGANDKLRIKHYDKSLRMLWKAEQHAPHTGTDFKDLTKDEKAFLTQAKDSLSVAEKKELDRYSTEEYKALINAHYTQEQKQAIVNVLSLIAHGERMPGWCQRKCWLMRRARAVRLLLLCKFLRRRNTLWFCVSCYWLGIVKCQDSLFGNT